MRSAQYLGMDIEKRVVSNNCVYFLSDPDLILFTMVVLLVPDVDEIRKFQTHNKEKVVGVGNEKVRFAQIWVFMS